MATRSQKWSKVAHERVQQASNTYSVKRDRQKYRTSCRKMPGLLHQSGVLQSVVFQVARDEQGRRYIDDLCAALGETPVPNERPYEALIRRLQTMPSAEYMAMTAEVAEVAIWFSRFAQVAFAGEVDDAD